MDFIFPAKANDNISGVRRTNSSVHLNSSKSPYCYQGVVIIMAGESSAEILKIARTKNLPPQQSRAIFAPL